MIPLWTTATTPPESVGVGVVLRGAAVRGPAGVTDPVGP